MELLIDKVKMYKLGENGLRVFHNIPMEGWWIDTIGNINYPTQVIETYDDELEINFTDIKPILQPMKKGFNLNTDMVSFKTVMDAINDFYDVFGLIESGQAVAYDPVKHNNCYE